MNTPAAPTPPVPKDLVPQPKFSEDGIDFPKLPQFIINSLVDYVEYHLHLHNRPPLPSQLSDFSHVNLEQIYHMLEDVHSPFNVRLERRGLPSPVSEEISGVNADLDYANWLTPQQVAVINCITDFRDPRSVEKRLKEMGVPVLKYRGWLSNPSFKNYLISRADKSIIGHIPEVHRRVVQMAEQGDNKAQKLFYELSGRITRAPKVDLSTHHTTNINQSEVFVKLVEAVQRHVRDPEILAAIAKDFEAIAAAPSTNRALPPNAQIQSRPNPIEF